eukprot:TRINITY_DN2630_c0_g1_i1.p1 TRINITY_DN2630_c0_g1~~TRINITY_DN2630_c0_g1_i1.p1  ORF type:complete len:190 (-),score=-13.07 TRINITY_DN2630_c0_g1_i1:119-688(-)
MYTYVIFVYLCKYFVHFSIFLNLRTNFLVQILKHFDPSIYYVYIHACVQICDKIVFNNVVDKVDESFKSCVSALQQSQNFLRYLNKLVRFQSGLQNSFIILIFCKRVQYANYVSKLFFHNVISLMNARESKFTLIANNNKEHYLVICLLELVININFLENDSKQLIGCQSFYTGQFVLHRLLHEQLQVG